MSRKNTETRNRILNTTWQLLEANNANGVRMTDIAKAAGLSRQAVYLHFPTRSELLIATVRYVDQVKHMDQQLIASRTAKTGIKRLNSFIEMWGNYIPEIYGIGKALIAMQNSDEAAKLAWDDRMQAVRHGCQAAINALKADGHLTQEYSTKQATDILWTMLSLENWQQYRFGCGWSQTQYIKNITTIIHKTLVNKTLVNKTLLNKPLSR